MDAAFSQIALPNFDTIVTVVFATCYYLTLVRASDTINAI